MSIKDAKKALEEVGLSLKLNVPNEAELDKANTFITDQTPKQGITQEKGASIMCDV